MKPLLARHDNILRAAIEANHGRVIKNTGDGCYAVFESAARAISAVLAAQQALLSEPWTEIQPQSLRVRMGVFTGEAEARAGDYYGSAVNRAARLMSVGHGGQVLVSAVTTELVRDQLPAGATLRDLGEHRLKDLVRPEHVFQLVHPVLPDSFPPLNSLDAFPNNLPVQITSFVGREREIGEVKQLISSTRPDAQTAGNYGAGSHPSRPSGTQSSLVTLTGSGGTGKTRLSLQIATEVLPSFTGGVWLVELAPLSDPTQVLPAVAAVLDLRSVPGMPLLNLVTDYLRGKQLLLILDNCEHLIGTCAELADHLLRACPGLNILASSREALGIAGEVSYRVPSLSLPVGENPTPEMLSTCEAAQLFVERATAVNPRFALTAGNAPAVGQICRRLDGIPLALELAAARIKLFPAEQIAARLNDVFRLLTGGSRTALPRQQTLRALIDWSYDLLSEPERALLRRLSVFIGGWTFEAADAVSTTLQAVSTALQAVCPDLDVMNLLEQLVNKSLVVMEEERGEARYHMLETIRQYAREKLSAAGEATASHDRHLDYFLQLSEQAEPELRGSGAFACFERLALDQENLDAAIEWGSHHGRLEDVLILSGNLIFYFAFLSEDRLRLLQRMQALLARLDEQPRTGAITKRRLRARSRGLAIAGLLSMSLGDGAAAVAAFMEVVALERQLGDRFWLGLSLGLQANYALASGIDANVNARDAAEESLALLHEFGERRWPILASFTLSIIEGRRGNRARAQLLQDEIRRNLDHIDHPMFMTALLVLGLNARSEGHLAEAREYFRRALAVAQQLKTRYFEATLKSQLAHVARQEGDLQQAKASYRRLIWTWKDLGQVMAVANMLECFAFIARLEREPERAARLLGAAEALRETTHVLMIESERHEYDAVVAALRGEMAADAFASGWAQGRVMDIEQAINYATTPQ
jgi:predicted ATPase